VTGDIRFLGSTGSDPDLGPVVVYLMPHSQTHAASGTDPHRPLVITSRHAAFDPALVAVRRGQRVVFANEGPLNHALFSADLPGARFEIPPGTRTRDITLPPVGPVRFYCSLHSEESFVVFASDTDYLALVEGNSPYSLGPLAAGTYTLSIFSERVSGPIRDIVVNGYSRAIEPVWIDPALVHRATEIRADSR